MSLLIPTTKKMFQDFTLDFYFRQFWTDPRLAYKKRTGVETLSVGSEFIRNIWVPDTFFVNEKQSYFHIATTSNEFIRIHHSGSITRSIRQVPFVRNNFLFKKRWAIWFCFISDWLSPLLVLWICNIFQWIVNYATLKSKAVSWINLILFPLAYNSYKERQKPYFIKLHVFCFMKQMTYLI